MYSPSINKLISAFKKLPTVGQRTAERFVFHLLKTGKREVTDIATALQELLKKVKSCEICWDFSDQSPCQICLDPKRDRSLICVVADPPDRNVIENTKIFPGRYHLLRGLIDTSDEESLGRTKIKELLDRISSVDQKTKTPETEITEVILALNQDLPGETTMLYLEKELKNIRPNLKVSRLARGLPLGADLRYADEITLGSAIKNRMPKN